MARSVEGVYRNGKAELMEPLPEAEGSRVIVTWVGTAAAIDLRERGIGEPEAADLHRRLAPFADEWDRPEMAAYDELPPKVTSSWYCSRIRTCEPRNGGRR